MSAAVHQFQILNAVVQCIAVPMVNDFLRRQGTAKRLLHDVPMLEDANTVNPDFSVAVRSYRFTRTRQSSCGVTVLFLSQVMKFAEALGIMALIAKRALAVLRWPLKETLFRVAVSDETGEVHGAETLRTNWLIAKATYLSSSHNHLYNKMNENSCTLSYTTV